MILNVFTRIGVRLSVANAYQQLIALNPNDPYAKHKAAGSLGGAVNGGTITLQITDAEGNVKEEPVDNIVDWERLSDWNKFILIQTFVW